MPTGNVLATHWAWMPASAMLSHPAMGLQFAENATTPVGELPLKTIAVSVTGCP
mgnify:CR=1 FL=1